MAEPHCQTPDRDTRRLVLGAAVGFGVPQVQVFVESLRGQRLSRRRRHAGRADGLCAGGLSAPPWRDPEAHLVHPPLSRADPRLPLSAVRDCPQRGRSRYDEVLISDVRDVAFQAHPFDGIASPACHFFLEGDNRTIGNEPTNMVYVRTFLPPEDVERLKPYRISCCGVVLGGMAAMTAYLARMNADLAAVPLGVRRKIGADTAFHNRIAHLTQDMPVVVVENNVHVATMGIEPAAAYRVGPDNADAHRGRRPARDPAPVRPHARDQGAGRGALAAHEACLKDRLSAARSGCYRARAVSGRLKQARRSGVPICQITKSFGRKLTKRPRLRRSRCCRSSRPSWARPA